MPDQPAAPESAKSFEQALAELEEIVAQLEAGEKPLDESLALYEKGVGALKHCHGILDKAEKRIRLLVKNSRGEPELREAESVLKTPAPVEKKTRAGKENQNSAEENVDSGTPSGQNPSPSVKTKPRTTPGKPNAAGGSLFGSSQ